MQFCRSLSLAGAHCGRRLAHLWNMSYARDHISKQKAGCLMRIKRASTKNHKRCAFSLQETQTTRDNVHASLFKARPVSIAATLSPVPVTLPDQCAAHWKSAPQRSFCGGSSCSKRGGGNNYKTTRAAQANSTLAIPAARTRGSDDRSLRNISRTQCTQRLDACTELRHEASDPLVSLELRGHARPAE